MSASNINGWGRGTWGEAAWNEDLVVSVTGVALTLSQGDETARAEASMTVTGIGLTSSQGN